MHHNIAKRQQINFDTINECAQLQEQQMPTKPEF